MTTPQQDKTPLSAYEALQDMRKAQEAETEAHAKWTDAFDVFLDQSDRPIGLRDLMFALAVINEIVSTALSRFEEINNEVPPADRLTNDTFEFIEHSALRDVLFNLYFSHRGVEIPDEFFNKFDTPKCHATHAARIAEKIYREARQREGIPSGQTPKPAA